MLECLRIKNLAIIDEAEISFRPGLNILSGETGAGKSIVISAISILLGSRANIDLIRAGADEALVEGLFNLKSHAWIEERLERLGFSASNQELLIKRVIHRGGRHRITVNGELATLTLLQELCDGLVDLCGQHEHQSLTKPATQLEMLDRFASLEKRALEGTEMLRAWKKISEEILQLTANRDEQVRRADYLAHQVKEIREAALASGEDAELQAEKQLLLTSGKRVEILSSLKRILDSEEEAGGAMASLRLALQRARALSEIDPQGAQELVGGMERAVAEAEEVLRGTDHALNRVESDPGELERVQERLSLIADLKKKHGGSIDEILNRLASLESELEVTANIDERLQSLEGEQARQRTHLEALGRQLSEKRTASAKKLSKEVSEEFSDLKMEGAQLKIELESVFVVENWAPKQLADRVQFVVQTNVGETFKPLSKIASGGELSRMTLAIRRVMGDHGQIGVYLFDEIDAGIGGQTAFQVGKKLKSVAAHNQVICITHLAQVASFADHHLNVCKVTKAGRTLTQVVELQSQARKEEIARMLAGPELTNKSLENAQDLMNLATVGTTPKKMRTEKSKLEKSLAR